MDVISSYKETPMIGVIGHTTSTAHSLICRVGKKRKEEEGDVHSFNASARLKLEKRTSYVNCTRKRGGKRRRRGGM